MNKYIKILDRVFSEYIRKKNANHQGFVTCITCKKIEFWKDTDAGHYISREHLETRFDERNVWPQCRACNRFHEGRKDEYALALIEKFGESILKELNKAKYSYKRYSEGELKNKIK